MTGRGLILAAPTSRSGKTTLTLGLARALRTAGRDVRCAKSGPDYIDSAYLAAASGAACVNLDAHAMSALRLRALASGPGLLLIEGAMGLFDGAPPDGRGSVADLAGCLDLPVVLVIDCASMAQSIAPLVAGFLGHRPGLRFAGLILNRVGSPRHADLLRASLADIAVPILGVVSRHGGLARPSRHLGLVQAAEDGDLDGFLDRAAALVSRDVNLAALTEAAAPLAPMPADMPPGLPPLGQRIAVADDLAFAFTYPHLLADWRRQGAEILPFSPLADQAPAPDADAIFLPGGYPELHALHLTRAGRFRAAMAAAARAGTTIYGECGGYMVLGRSLTDRRGIAYPMCGLLDLETSFAARKLHLGYRQITPLGGPWSGPISAHEFHYATIIRERGTPLFSAKDATGAALGDMGLCQGSVAGSFAHVIDRAPF